MKKCIYCGTEIDDLCILDFCERCGISSFGKKMFETIKDNMEKAKDNKDLLNNY